MRLRTASRIRTIILLLAFRVVFSSWPGNARAASGEDREPPVIRHERLARAQVGEPVLIRASIMDASAIFAAAVYVRPNRGASYQAIAMKKVGEEFQTTIPAELLFSDLEYFIEAFDEQGNGPTREGSPDAPIAIHVFNPSQPAKQLTPLVLAQPTDERETKTSIGDEWWFWGIVATAIAGGATLTVLLLQGNGTPNAVDIEIRGPDPAGGS